MKCSVHTNLDAVGQCAECGAGVCSHCAEATSYARQSYGTLCLSCCSEKLSEAEEFYRKDKRKRLTRIIVSLILYFFGMIAIITSLTSTPVLFQMTIVGVIFCGIYTGLTWRKAAKESHEQYEREHGAEYVITDSGVYRKDGFFTKLIFFLIGTAFGVIVTPIRFITDMVGIGKDNKSIRELQDERAELESVARPVASTNSF